jgi:hypothetical protein
MTRSQITSTVGQNSGGAVSPVVSGKNAIINGGFDVFQRSSFSSTSAGYALDRWYVTCSGSSSATVVTQQTTGVPLGARYCMRIAMGASGGYGNPAQYIETANVSQFWGQTVVLTAKIRRNATFSGSISISLDKSSTVDAGSSATWTTLGGGTATNANIPTGTGSSNWYTFTIQATVPNDGTANSLRVSLGQYQTEATGAYWELANVQLEQGTVATPFSRASENIGQELAACKRYYQRYYGAVGMALNGIGYTTTSLIMQYTLPTEMRVSPSVAGSGTINISDQYVNDIAASSIAVNQVQGNGPMGGRAVLGGFTSVVVGRYYSAPASYAGGGYFEFSADL